MATERDIVDEALIKWQHAVEGGPGGEGSPLIESVDYLRELTKLPEWPEWLKELLWAYHTKDIILGYLTREDRNSLKNRAALIADIIFIMLPDFRLTVEKLLHITNFKHLLLNQALRGADGFERTMETQQTRLAITENKAGASLTSPRRTFFGRLTSLFGGGGR